MNEPNCRVSLGKNLSVKLVERVLVLIVEDDVFDSDARMFLNAQEADALVAFITKVRREGKL